MRTRAPRAEKSCSEPRRSASSSGDSALMVLATGESVTAEVVERLLAAEGVISVAALDIS